MKPALRRKVILVLLGMNVALITVLGVVRLLRPPCVPAPGNWYWEMLGVTGSYRDRCGVFPVQVREDGFPYEWRFNNYGLNDRDYTLEKSPDSFRILVVGDSFPQGLQVEQDQNFPALLETLLNADSSRTIEVINLSVDAYGNDRQLLMYGVLGWQFQPDLVLLSLYTGNDIQDNHYDLETLRYGFQGDRPYFTLESDGLRVRNSPVYEAAVYPEAPVWQWLTDLQSRGGEVLPANLPGRPTVLAVEPYQLEYPVELGVYLPEDAYWREAWAITEALILEFRHVIEQVEGVSFAAVVIPDRRAIHEQDWMNTVETYGALLPELREADPAAPSNRLIAFLEAHNIPALNLADALADEAARTDERLYYMRDGHFNALGHRVAAHALAQWLETGGLLP